MNDADLLALPARDLTAHQPPALLVERVLSLRPGGGRVAVSPHQGLDALQLCEASAQALAILMGVRVRRSGLGTRAGGMLVGAKRFTCRRDALADEVLAVECDSEQEFGGLQLHRVRVLAGEDEIAVGELKTLAGAEGGPA